MPPGEDAISLTLRSMQEGDAKVVVSPSLTISDLIQQNFDTNKRIRLFCVGKEIKPKNNWGEDWTLEDYNIKDGMTV